MKKFAIIFWVQIFILFKIGVSQNLVPNGGFESYIVCPFQTSQIYLANGWFQPCKSPGNNSVNYSSSSDYFNSCVDSLTTSGVPNNFAGFQNPKTGNGYIGIVLYTPYLNQNAFREYAEVKLSQTLQANKKYNLKYYISLANTCRFSITKFDAYLSNDSLLYVSSNYMKIPLTPQIQYSGRVDDTLNWIEITGNFVAIGGENYLTLGNFQDGAFCDSLRIPPSPNTISNPIAYYYYDDVSLVEDTITDIEEVNDQDFSFYPNPAQNIIKVNSQHIIQEISVMDFRQRNIIILKPNKSNLEIDIS